MALLTLGGSVGRGGANASADVRTLKDRLIALGFDWLPADDKADAALESTIDLVQSIVRGRETVQGDGRVDVPGTTYDWLRASNAPGWQTMPAGGAAGDGFVNFELTDTRDHHDFGTSWLALTIQTAGRYYRDDYLASHAGGAVITVNDASLPRGGDTPDHHGHETGLACDFRLPRSDGTAPGGTSHTSATYDRDATRAMLKAFRHQPHVTRIYFNDRALINEGLCAHAGGHDDHFHVGIEPLAPLSGYDAGYDALFDRAIAAFGGTVTAPGGFPMTLDGFQDYLDAVTVAHFSAREMLTPHHQDVATALGFDKFLPPHDWWLRGAALALIADELRNLVGEPVVLRNWWRPKLYNAQVDGAGESDHITAHGVDLDYRSAASRRRAEQRLRELYSGEEWLQLSLGLGNLTTHVGILSPGRRREWHYDSYVP
ncbi:MAG TPA: D-Ala-D-Ala carboxypeptidase family metallohydrolase [Trueperaceae bacterium]|nr:D-Ala-D-Ala carboxypeptidase family metallohydrolase [Trueperaceae bacterium]